MILISDLKQHKTILPHTELQKAHTQVVKMA